MNRVVAKNATVQAEGNKMVRRTIEFYNLDVIISVGYRVKSKNGIAGRKTFAISELTDERLVKSVIDRINVV